MRPSIAKNLVILQDTYEGQGIIRHNDNDETGFHAAKPQPKTNYNYTT